MTMSPAIKEYRPGGGVTVLCSRATIVLLAAARGRFLRDTSAGEFCLNV